MQPHLSRPRASDCAPRRPPRLPRGSPLGLALLLLAPLARAAELFVAPAGADANPGTRERPYATLQRAQQAAAPGDTVFVRGGTYRLRTDQIAKRHRIWAWAVYLDKSGRPGQPIRYEAFPGEQPVFDFAEVKPAGCRVSAFHVRASHVVLKGFEIAGVQVTLTNHTQSICVENAGSHNRFERLVMRDGMAIGYYSVRGANNLVLNCDAFRNHDPVSEGGRGGNVDGFGCHPGRGGTNNVFRGCRAWFNSDDGYDCINAHEAVTFERCWAFWNGYAPGFKSLADGNGFKAGGYAATPADQLPRPIPRHRVLGCLAVRNKASGFYANHHPGGCDWLGNASSGNRRGFNMQGRLPDNRTEAPGSGHRLWNNLSFREPSPLVNADAAACDLRDNRFGAELPRLDDARLAGPRQPDGSLPEVSQLPQQPPAGR